MLASIFHGTLPFIMDAPAPSRGSKGNLDSFKARILCKSNWEADARTLGFEIDKKIPGFHSLWVKSMEPTIEADDVYSVEITGEGLSNIGERRQRKIKCGEHQISIGPNEKIVIVYVKDETGVDPETGDDLPLVPRRQTKLDEYGEPVLKDIVTPSGVMKRWLVSEAEVVVIDTYFTTTKPDMTVIGTALAPPNPPTPPNYIWGSYTEALRGQHPQGWSLIDRDVDEIAIFSDTDGLWRVSDTTAYRQPAFPD